MSLAMKARQKGKKKGATRDKVFGCDLLEHLQLSGQEVPQVLKSCTEFVEEHGIVDGIYRLCGIASNVQKLRQEFDMERPPNLNKDTYLQDVHCVSSLCKAYFRELPNPLLTYQLYDKFADAVAVQLEEQRLIKIKEVLKSLPLPHYRTLEFLMKHLVHMASFCSLTNMHARNLAIVWAPNLLRSKDIESTGFNGTAAFMEVRIQSIVVEFILTHVEQLFGDPLGSETAGCIPENPPSYTQDDYLCSLTYNIPSMLNQGDGPPQIRPYHTIIDISDHKRKGSVKAKKWKSIFNLGRSNNDSKRKSSKQSEKDESLAKMSLRPAKSMDSLSSDPYTADEPSILIRKKSAKRRESFDAKDGSFIFLKSDGKSTQIESKNSNQPESEEEATAKSEPTTPKPGRSSIIETPQGRSPKSTQNRAEKCVGVHISGPFSVTLPLHITSNLSRLTRGMECPSLNYTFSPKSLDSSNFREESKCELKQFKSLVYEHDDKDEPCDTQTDAKEEATSNIETYRLSLEVQDTFSFLDSPDTNQELSLSDIEKPEKEDSPEEKKSGYTESCFPLDNEILEDELRGVSDDMIGIGMQIEEFSVEPPPDDLSEDDSDQMYYIPTGCLDIEYQSREIEDSLDDVYLSAYNDLSPLVQELENPLELLNTEASEMPLSICELQKANSNGSVCQNSVDELKEIQSDIQPTVGNSTVVEEDTLSLTSASTSGNSEESQDNEKTLVHCEKQSIPVKEFTKDNFKDLIINCEVDLFLKEMNEDNLNVPAFEDPALCENDLENPQASYSCHEEDTIDHGQQTQPCTGEEQTLTHHIQNEYENDFKCPPSSYFNTEFTYVDSYSVNCMVETKVDSILSEPENMQGIGRLDNMDETITNTPADYQACSAEKYSTQTITTFSNDADSFSVNCMAETKVDSILSEPENMQGIGRLDNMDETITKTPADYQTCSAGKYSTQTITRFSNETDKQPITGRYPDGSVSMKLTNTTYKIQQVKSVPVVPPKPQFAKISPALKSKIHVSPAFTTSKDAKANKSENIINVDVIDSCSASLQKQRSANWKSSGSVSFDTAVARAKERQSPVRRMQTYCIGDTFETLDYSKVGNPNHIQYLGNRINRPFSCVVHPNSAEVVSKGNSNINDGSTNTLVIHGSDSVFNPELVISTQELPVRNRLSMPRIGKRSSSEEEPCGISMQNRRSLI
ncbi:rho GTPase-activating protein 30 [Bombina bombina]|uniref:rho GTPase-activating protein 30 n=1 Tax=Bombina bombina TaxID=8345 RepID=UPI00235B0998|nr:rho GTPase-activating protein 30 [Bombina bombina]